VLLSLYDARSWARDQGNWRPRWERVVQVLAVALNHRRVQHRLELADTHDGLTGLANRQRFNDVLRAFRGELSVLYVDIDRFRSVNDDHGHFAGDRVLVEVARRLRQACRAGDVVARLGGDEFGIILQGANAQEAVMVGQRIIEAVNEPLPLGVGPLNIAVSVGLARSQLPFGHSPALVDLADRAMYHAKRAGGGRLAVAHPPGSLSTGDDSPMGGLLAIE
jgi:diguanylate cyclase (GGDEF)-like protein